MANAIVTQRDTQLERQRAGYIQLSLTNFTNDDEPTISAGSVVEISGTLYSVTGNESITDWAGISNGPAWIKLVPDGTDPFTAEYTDVAPTWLDAKQGWYDGTGTDRYVAGLTKTGASGYAEKHVITEIGTFDEIFPGDKTWTSNRGPVLRGMGNRVLTSGVITSPATYVIPRGEYHLYAFGTDTGERGIVSIYDGSTWVTVGNINFDDSVRFQSFVISDGTNIQIERSAGTQISWRLFNLGY